MHRTLSKGTSEEINEARKSFKNMQVLQHVNGKQRWAERCLDHWEVWKHIQKVPLAGTSDILTFRWLKKKKTQEVSQRC